MGMEEGLRVFLLRLAWVELAGRRGALEGGKEGGRAAREEGAGERVGGGERTVGVVAAVVAPLA
jgi:hypothetical protein